MRLYILRLFTKNDVSVVLVRERLILIKYNWLLFMYKAWQIVCISDFDLFYFVKVTYQKGGNDTLVFVFQKKLYLT